MSDPTRLGTTGKPRATKKTSTAGGGSGIVGTVRTIGDIPAALTEMARETRGGGEHVVDAISHSSDCYRQELQRSLAGIRKRLSDPDLSQDERLRLEKRQDQMLDRLNQDAQDQRQAFHEAHHDLIKPVLAVGGVAVLGGAYLLGGPGAVAGVLNVLPKATSKAIEL